MQRGWHTEGISGTIGVISDSSDIHDMLCGDT
jgi:hypothetical protein